MSEFVEGKNKEVRAKNNSLAVVLDEDEERQFSFYVYDRRTKLVVCEYNIHPDIIPNIDNLENIPKRKRSKHR